MGPGDLAQALRGLELGQHPSLLVGLERADDAGVYQLTEDLALVQTLDFFTPIVDEPFVFGQVAAANALSDVYAMAGRPLCAMNIVCFPSKKLDLGVLREVLQGGLSKLHEAGAALAGGHSVDDNELKFGLAVTGVVHPKRFWTKGGARLGDQLLLSKPLGTGVIATALKRGQASVESVRAMEQSMTALNRRAMELLLEGEVHACTDVTGYGLLGHACEMLDGASVGYLIRASAVPLLPGALEYAARDLKPGGLRRNREYRASQVQLQASVPSTLAELLFDPQTSGGLLAAVPAARTQLLLDSFAREGLTAAVIGEVVGQPRGEIVVT